MLQYLGLQFLMCSPRLNSQPSFTTSDLLGWTHDLGYNSSEVIILNCKTTKMTLAWHVIA